MPCTVIVAFRLVTYELESLLEKIKRVLPALKKQPGFQGVQVLVGEDRRELVTITSWSDRSSYDASQTSPEIMAAGMELIKLLEKGEIEMAIKVYKPYDLSGQEE